MKYTNQKMYNGRMIKNTINKPLLHKKGKQWIIVGLSALMLAGFGGAVDLSRSTVHVNASTVQTGINKTLAQNDQQTSSASNHPQASASANNSQVSNSNTRASSISTSKIIDQAKTMHANLLNKTASNDMNILNLGTPAQQKRSWNFVQHGIGGHDFDNTKANSDNTLNEHVQNNTGQLGQTENAPTNEVKDNSKKTTPKLDNGNYFGLNYSYNPANSTVVFTDGTYNRTSMNDYLAHAFDENIKNAQNVIFSSDASFGNATDFSSAFAWDSDVYKIDLSGVDVTKGANFKYAFDGDPNLKEVDLPIGFDNWNAGTGSEFTNDKKLSILSVPYNPSLPTVFYGGNGFSNPMSDSNGNQLIEASKGKLTQPGVYYTNSAKKNLNFYDGLAYTVNGKTVTFTGYPTPVSDYGSNNHFSDMLGKAPKDIQEANVINFNNITFPSNVKMSDIFDGAYNNGNNLVELNFNHCDFDNINSVKNGFSQLLHLNQISFNGSKGTVNDSTNAFAGDPSLQEVDFGNVNFKGLNNAFGKSGKQSDTGLQRLDLNNNINLSGANLPNNNWHNSDKQDANLANGNSQSGMWYIGKANAKQYYYYDINNKSDNYTNLPGHTSDPTSTLNGNWAWVDANGNLSNHPQFTKSDRIMVMPEFDGMIYKYNQANKSLEFTQGTFEPYSYGTKDNASDMLGHMNGDVGHISTTIKFDSNINYNNKINPADMFDGAYGYHVKNLILPSDFSKNFIAGTHTNGMFTLNSLTQFTANNSDANRIKVQTGKTWYQIGENTYSIHNPIMTNLHEGPANDAANVTIDGRNDTITVSNGTLDNSHAGGAEFGSDVYTSNNQLVKTLPNENKDWKVVFNNVKAPQSATSLFDGKYDVKGTPETENWFGNQVASIDLTGLDMSNTNTMNSFLINNHALKSVNFGTKNLNKVNDMEMMLGSDTSLTKVDMSGITDHNLTDMHDMFDKDPVLTSVKLSSDMSLKPLDSTNKSDNLAELFASDYKLPFKGIKWNGFNTKYATNMSGMFRHDENLGDVTLPSTFDTSKVSNFGGNHDGMFESDGDGHNPLNNQPDKNWGIGMTSLDLSHANFDTSKATNVQYMFDDDKDLKSINFGSKFNTSNVTNMSLMFGNSDAISDLNLPSTFDTNRNSNRSNVNMSGMFQSDYEDGGLRTITINTPNTIINNNAWTSQNNYEHPFYKETGNIANDGKSQTVSTLTNFTGDTGTFTAKDVNKSNKIDTDIIDFQTTDGQHISDEIVSGPDGKTFDVSQHNNYIPNGYQLAGKSDSFTFGKLKGSAYKVGNQIAHVIQLKTNTNNQIPLSDNVADVNGTIDLHFINAQGHDQIIQLHYHKQMTANDNPVNLLEYSSDVPVSDPSEYSGISNVLVGGLDTSDYSYNSNNSNNTKLYNYDNYKITPSDAKYNNNSTNMFTGPTLNFYFNVNNATEYLKFVDNNGNLVVPSDNVDPHNYSLAEISGLKGAKKQMSDIKGDISSDYQINSDNPSDITINNSFDIIHVSPKQATDTIIYTNANGTKSFNGGIIKGSVISDITPSNVNMPNIPSNYHIVPNQVPFKYDNSIHKVEVAPDTRADSITFVNQHGKVVGHYNTGYGSITNQLGGNSDSDMVVNHIPVGYNDPNSNNSAHITYDGLNHVIDVIGKTINSNRSDTTSKPNLSKNQQYLTVNIVAYDENNHKVSDDSKTVYIPVKGNIGSDFTLAPNNKDLQPSNYDISPSDSVYSENITPSDGEMGQLSNDKTITWNYHKAVGKRSTLVYYHLDSDNGTVISSGASDESNEKVGSDINVNNIASVPLGYHLVKGGNLTGPVLSNNEIPSGYKVQNGQQILNFVVAHNTAKAQIQYTAPNGYTAKDKNGVQRQTINGKLISGNTGSLITNINSDGVPSGYHVISGQNFRIPSDNSDVDVKIAPDDMSSYVTINRIYMFGNHEVKAVDQEPVPINIEPNGTQTISPRIYEEPGYNTANSDWVIPYQDNPIAYTNMNKTFTYTATPVDIQVEYVNANDNNKQVGSDQDLGAIGVAGQKIDVNANTPTQIGTITGQGIYTENGTPVTFNVPAGYHLKNANNIITVTPELDNYGKAKTNSKGQPMMLLAMPMLGTSTPKPSSSSANGGNNKPASSGSSSASSSNNIPNKPASSSSSNGNKPASSGSNGSKASSSNSLPSQPNRPASSSDSSASSSNHQPSQPSSNGSKSASSASNGGSVAPSNNGKSTSSSASNSTPSQPNNNPASSANSNSGSKSVSSSNSQPSSNGSNGNSVNPSSNNSSSSQASSNDNVPNVPNQPASSASDNQPNPPFDPFNNGGSVNPSSNNDNNYNQPSSFNVQPIQPASNNNNSFTPNNFEPAPHYVTDTVDFMNGNQMVNSVTKFGQTGQSFNVASDVPSGYTAGDTWLSFDGSPHNIYLSKLPSSTPMPSTPAPVSSTSAAPSNISSSNTGYQSSSASSHKVDHPATSDNLINKKTTKPVRKQSNDSLTQASKRTTSARTVNRHSNHRSVVPSDSDPTPSTNHTAGVSQRGYVGHRETANTGAVNANAPLMVNSDGSVTSANNDTQDVARLGSAPNKPSVKPTESNRSNRTDHKSGKLPQTGENDSSKAALAEMLGTISTLLVGADAIIRKRRRDE